jgi:hypothetical protein
MNHDEPDRPKTSPESRTAREGGVEPERNREPGVNQHPLASRPLRDLGDRGRIDERTDEGAEHLYGERALDGNKMAPNYFGGRPRGRQVSSEEADPEPRRDDGS